MNKEDYIEQRLNDQIRWYSAKSASNQKKYKNWQVVKVISALFITLLSIVVNKFEVLTIVIGILGAFIVFIESFIKIFNYEKLWLQYRTTSERLKKEKILFQTKSKPYHEEDAFEFLVQQCEDIMQNEVQGWIELVGKEK